MRNLSTAMYDAVTARMIRPAILADLTFKSSTVHLWTGIGNLSANGFTYQGIGGLGSVGTVTENTTVEAAGTSVTLNGVDPTLYADAISDIVTGLPAQTWLACLSLTGDTVLGTMLMFSGQIDLPTVSEDGDNIAITLALETTLTNLQRANRRLYTAAEQRRTYPTDSGFDNVEWLQDTANGWG